MKTSQITSEGWKDLLNVIRDEVGAKYGEFTPVGGNCVTGCNIKMFY